MKICIIGCGSMGSALTEAAAGMDTDGIFVHDIVKENALSLERRFPGSVKAVDSPGGVFGEIDLLIEAASHEAVREFVPAALKRGINSIIMSVGALGNKELLAECREAANTGGARIIIPSGAVAGVDAIVSASAGRIDEVCLTTVKNPRSLKGSRDYLMQKGIDIDNLAERMVIFEGNAREVVKVFPKNVNVAATISIAGIGFERTMVTVIADPEAERTEHHIEIKGEAGTVKTTVQNIPDEKNPGTSHLAVLSAIAAMRNMGGGIWVV